MNLPLNKYILTNRKALIAISFAVWLCVCSFVGVCGKPVLQLSDTSLIKHLLTKANNTLLTNPDSARSLAERCLFLSKSLKYNTGIGRSFQSIGATYWAQSYNSISLFFLFKSVPYLNNDRATLCDAYKLIGRNYIDLGNYIVGETYINNAILLANKLKDDGRIEQLYNERSLLFFYQKKYPEALNLARKGLLIDLHSKDFGSLAITYNRLATIYGALNERSKCNLYLDSSMVYAVLSNNNRLKAANIYKYANLAYHSGDYSNALSWTQKAIVLDDSIGAFAFKAKAYKLLIDIYKKQNNVTLSAKVQQQYINLLDTISKKEQSNSFSLIQHHFSLNDKLLDIEKMQDNLSQKNVELTTQRKVITSLTVSLIIVSLALIVIFLFYKQKEKLSQELIIQRNTIQEQSQKLQELNNLKDKLFAVISHDLRSPISNLRMMLELFHNQSISPEDITGILREMVPAIEGADLIMTNLLNWAVSQMSGIKVKKSDVELLGIIEETHESFSYLLSTKQIVIHNHINKHHFVHADKEHLRIVFRNLVSNAIKFTPHYGQIFITSWLEGSMITCDVKDTGKGMTPDEVAKLFGSEHFTKRGTEGEKGAGIGLILCQEMIESNGGSITVTSEPENGSTFSVNLPVNANHKHLIDVKVANSKN